MNYETERYYNMNLRVFKKDIEYVLGAFIDDCSVFANFNADAPEEELSKLFDEAVDLYNELKDKVNTRDIEGNKRTYYNNLRQEVLTRTDALYEKLSAVVRDHVKAAGAAE